MAMASWLIFIIVACKWLKGLREELFDLGSWLKNNSWLKRVFIARASAANIVRFCRDRKLLSKVDFNLVQMIVSRSMLQGSSPYQLEDFI